MLGAGFMGAGIAYVRPRPASRWCCSTATWSRRQGQGALAQAELGAGEAGPRRPRTRSAAVAITPTADFGELAGCDLVIEAVFEDRAVKAEVTEEGGSGAEASAVFASNTSTMPITGLAEEFGAAEEFHRHPLLLAGRQDDAGRDHPRQEDRRRDAGDARSTSCGDPEDADRRQRHARLLHRCVLRLHARPSMLIEGVPGADDRERAGRRHAGRSAGADRRDGDRPRRRS